MKQIFYCIDCGEKVSKENGRCSSCAQKYYYKIHPEMKKDKNYCKDCGKEVSDYRVKRCKSCARKEVIRKNEISMKGQNHPNYIDGRSLKKYYCIECKEKICWQTSIYEGGRCLKCANKGKNNPNYIDGTGNYPYPLAFNSKLKLEIRKRDNYTCQNCDMTEEKHLIVFGQVLAIHHIDYDKENCKKKNLITLCKQCNARANYNRNYWIDYFKNKLNKKRISNKVEE